MSVNSLTKITNVEFGKMINAAAAVLAVLPHPVRVDRNNEADKPKYSSLFMISHLLFC